MVRGARDWQAGREVSPARLADQPAALLGATYSYHLLPAARGGTRAGGATAGGAARSGELDANGYRRIAARGYRGVRQYDLSHMWGAGQAGNGCQRQLPGLRVVLPALPLQRWGYAAVGPGTGAQMAAG